MVRDAIGILMMMVGLAGADSARPIIPLIIAIAGMLIMKGDVDTDDTL